MPQRMGWDSNPRATFAAAGFQDRCIQPLCHPSESGGCLGAAADRRRQKLAKMQTKLKKATTSEKLAMAEKLRKMTAGCNDLIARMGLEDRKR
jgi:hypothetical protein